MLLTLFAVLILLEFQAGVYHHRTDLEGPGILRAYDRQLPDGRAHVVLIRE
jgi:hypothetical protein